MKIGDIVRYRGRGWGEWIGIIIREIPGYAEYKRVVWTNSEDGDTTETSCEAKNLCVINEDR